MPELSGKAQKMLEEQLGREERAIDTYSYYSSQAGNPALSSILNEFVREKAQNIEALRSLLGETGKNTDAFEEQIYQNQVGGPNPGGYRPGGTAGTETIGPRPCTKPAGDNVGFEAAQLEFGWYEPVTHGRPVSHGRPVTPPAGSIQSTDIARGKTPSGGYMSAAFVGGAQSQDSDAGPARQSAADEYLPWVTSDDDAIMRDVASKEREADAQYSSIIGHLSQASSESQSRAMDTLQQIREGIKRRIERVTEAAGKQS